MEHTGVSINQLLQDAALKGDVAMLRDLISQDPLLLHKPSKIRPLHIACRLGHLQFTEELLRLNPSLAEELNPTDKSSPLHLASGNGHVDLVKALVSTNPCACLARDLYGRNPAHVAAVKGHVLVLEELIRAVPASVRERVGGGGEGESILHLCVKFNQLEALSVVAGKAGQAAAFGETLLNAKDGDGNTILHIAVADQRLEIVHFLVNDNRVNINERNGDDLTAMDIYLRGYGGLNKNPVLRFTLEQGNALRSKQIKEHNKKVNRFVLIENHGNALMVVASLVATMAFQAGLSPPGQSSQLGHHKHEFYSCFTIANTIGLVSSMSSIILLISGLPGRRFFMILVMVMMWVAVTSMTYVYGISIQQFRQTAEESASERRGDRFYIFYFYVWCLVMVILLAGHLLTCPKRLNKLVASG